MIGLFDANTHNSRMAKYWVAKEMAQDIAMNCFGKEHSLEKIKNHLKQGYVQQEINVLTQTLKKEWFK